MKLHLGVHDRFVEQFKETISTIDNMDVHSFVVYGNVELPFWNKNNDIEVLSNLSRQNEALIKKVIDSSTIYIHYLTDEVIDFLNEIDLTGKKVVWIFWGADGFSMPEIQNSLVNPISPFTPKEILRKIKRKLVRPKTKTKRLTFLKKINFFAHYIHEDFELFKPFLSEDVKFQYFSYGILEKLVLDLNLKGQDVLVGNSASASNQHKFILKKIKSLPEDSRIHCVLSYGGGKHYIDKVCEFGIKKFGRKFISYHQVMALKNYQETILNKSAYAIMAQNRPQGFGNILQLLYQGSKIFLLPENNLYKFLKRKGFFVFAIRNKLSTKDFIPLDPEGVKCNRVKLIENFSSQVMHRFYVELLSI